MTQREALLDLFRKNGNCLTLGQILQTHLAAEYRARMTDLRKEAYVITLERGKTPSDNRYTLIEKVKFEMEESGQLRIAI